MSGSSCLLNGDANRTYCTGLLEESVSTCKRLRLELKAFKTPSLGLDIPGGYPGLLIGDIISVYGDLVSTQCMIGSIAWPS